MINKNKFQADLNNYVYNLDKNKNFSEFSEFLSLNKKYYVEKELSSVLLTKAINTNSKILFDFLINEDWIVLNVKDNYPLLLSGSNELFYFTKALLDNKEVKENVTKEWIEKNVRNSNFKSYLYNYFKVQNF